MQLLSLEDRKVIEHSLRLKRSYREIAKALGRSHTSITREVKRNSKPGKPYTAAYAQIRADERIRKRRLYSGRIDADPNLYWYIRQKLREGWAPHVISGVMKKQKPPELKGASVCAETIYRYIYHGNGRPSGWFHHLPYKRHVRKKQHSRKTCKTAIPHRVSVHLRPPEINRRERYGDWESDTMKFEKQSVSLSVQSERKAKILRMHKISSMHAKTTNDAIIKTSETIPSQLMLTITFDNGTEGSEHYKLREYIPGVETFFCDPYAPYQKGGVENINGIIRRHLPFKTNLSQLTDYDIYCTQEKINNIPRKSLDYLTPNQVFNSIKQLVVH